MPLNYARAMTPEEELELFDAACAMAREQAIRDSDGEGVGAAALTDHGTMLTGVGIHAMVNSACLCAETGPICEAHRTGRAITASICVRWTERSGASVLAACGVCQERLAVFGMGLRVGVADSSQRGFRFASLTDLRPSPWWDVIQVEPRRGA